MEIQVRSTFDNLVQNACIDRRRIIRSAMQKLLIVVSHASQGSLLLNPIEVVLVWLYNGNLNRGVGKNGLPHNIETFLQFLFAHQLIKSSANHRGGRKYHFEVVPTAG